MAQPFVKKTFNNNSKPNTWARPSTGSRPTNWVKPSFGSKPTTGSRPTGNSNYKWVKKFNWPKITYINDQIKAPNIMIIDEEWTNLWTFSRMKAMNMADENGLDLVQIRYDAESMTSTVKMTDYGKYMYQKGKDEKEKKKKQKTKALKELKFRYAIWDNDLALKTKKAKELLTDWYSVKITIRLRWRERIYSDKVIEKLMSMKEDLSDVGKSQYSTPKKEAQWYSIILFAKSH